MTIPVTKNPSAARRREPNSNAEHPTERIERLRKFNGLPPTSPHIRTVQEIQNWQRSLWLKGAGPFLEEIVGKESPLLTGPEAFGLIYSEYLLREELHDKPALEDYQRRFPEHAAQLEQQIRLHRLLGSVAQPPQAGKPLEKMTVAVHPEPVAPHSELPVVPEFEILEELGRGGMGVVYKARQTSLNRIVALKVLKGGLFANPEQQARFRSEAELIARLQHPNIVQVYTVGTHKSVLGEAFAAPFFVQEYVDGGNLAQWLADRPQPPSEAAHFIEVLARAVQYAHEHGIVHRDLKPGNILVQAGQPGESITEDFEQPAAAKTVRLELGAKQVKGTPRRSMRSLIPKITDFGLAKELTADGSALTQDGTVLGTPEYMAPEQAFGSGGVGPAADIYALGVILYEMMTGRLPFEGANQLETLEQVRMLEPVPPSRLQPKTPSDLQTICLKCLNKDPKKRYLSALELAEDLRRFQRGEPIRARSIGVLERGWRWARRRPAISAMALLVALILIASVCGLTAAWIHALTGWKEAVRQRQQAIKEQFVAEEQGQRARDAQGVAERRREEAESTLYFSRIAQARLESRLSNIAAGRRILDLCVPGPDDKIDRRGWEWHYLLGLHHADLLTIPEPHLICVSSVCFSPDGRYLLTAGGSPFGTQPPDKVRIWSAFGRDAGECVREFPHPRRLDRASFALCGQRVVWSGIDCSLGIGDVASGEILETWHLPDGFHPATWSSDGSRYASSDKNGEIRVWETASDRQLLATKVGNWGPLALTFSPDGRQLAANGGTLRLLDIAAAKELFSYPLNGEGNCRPAFSPDGRLLAVGTNHGVVRVCDPANRQLVTSLSGHAGGVLVVAFSPSGLQLATAGADQSVRLWDLQTGSELLQFRGQQGRVSCLSFHPSGRYLASGGEQPSDVKLWDLTRPAEFLNVAPTVEKHGYLEAISFSADSNKVQMVSGPWLHTCRADSGTDGQSNIIDFGARWLVPSCRATFTTDGRKLAFVGKDDERMVEVLDTAQLKAPAISLQHDFPILHLSFSGDGRRLATSSSAGGRDLQRAIKVWDIRSSKEISTLACRRLPIGGLNGIVGLSPDGNLVAYDDLVSVEDNLQQGRYVLRIRDLRMGQTVFEHGHLGSVVRRLVFRPDGLQLAISLENGGVVLLDKTDESWTERVPLGGSEVETCWDLAYSPNGQRLAGVTRAQVHLWDSATGHSVLVLRGTPPRHRDGGFNPRIAWSPDGQRLAASNWNRTVTIWDAAARHTAAGKQAMHEAAELRAADLIPPPP